MPLTYDGEGRQVALAEAMQDPGTPLAGTRAERAAANSASAWIVDCNPAWAAGEGLTNMKFDHGQITDRMGTACSGNPSEAAGSGLVQMKDLCL